MKYKPSLHSFLPSCSLHTLRLAVTLGTISYAGISSLQAADIYWDGTSGSWNTVTNWSTDSAATTPDPVAVPGAADTAIFNISGATALQDVTLDANQSVAGLTFNLTGGGATNLRGDSVGVTDRTLAIGSGGITTAARAVEIGNTPATYGAVNIALGADQIWNNAGILNITGSISGNFQITKNGGQQLRVNGTNNSFSALIMNAGTVFSQISFNDTFLGSATNAQATVNGGRLALNRNTIEGTMTLNGGTLDSASGFGSTWNGSTILQSTSTIQGAGGAGTITMNAVISGSGGLTKGTKGTLTLTNANTFTGDTISQVPNSSILNLNNSLALQNSILDTAGSGLGTANDGIRTNQTTLTLGGLSGDKDLKSLFRTDATAGGTDVSAGGYNNLTALTLNPGTGKTPSYSGAIVDGATGMSLTKTGAGTQTLSGNNTYTGPTTINEGKLVITGATQNTSAITFGGGVLGFDVATPVAAASAAVDFTGQSVLVTGTPTLASYTLLTASSISGTPTLASPAPSGYEPQVVGNELRLVQTGSGATFATWIAGFGLDPAEQGFGFDADGDGIPNGVEAWFGTDPSVGGSGLTQVAKSGNTITFTHPEADPALSDVIGSYQWSLDLATWNASAATEGGSTVTLVPVQNDPTPGTTTVTATITGTEPTKVFIRAVATQP